MIRMIEAPRIAQDARNVHLVDEEDLELVAREFVELLVICESFKRGNKDHANKFLDYAAEMYMREPLFANAAVDAYVHRGGDLITLIQQARARRHEVKVGGWLSYLKVNCLHSDNEHARKFVRRAVERACLWMGMSTQETKDYLDCYNLRERD